MDPILIGQALGNLLENAARHSPPGAAVIVEVSPRRGYADEIEIAVSDSGPGVPPDQREMVFDLFHRGAGGGRAGLGLAIAKAFVEAHGGRIAVGAARGGGARFVLSLPAATAPDVEFASKERALS